MARLTWDGVAVPNFGNAVDGLATANQILNQGFNAAQRGVQKIEDDKRAALSNQAMLDVLKYQDPAALQADLASGALQARYKPGMLNKDAINAISGRQEDILQQAAGLMKHEQDKVKNADFQFINSEANRPIVNAYLNARSKRDKVGMEALMAANPEFFSRVNPDALLHYTKEGQEVFGTDTDRDQDITQFNWQGEDRTVGIYAEDLMQRALREGGDSIGMEGYLNANKEKIIASYDDPIVGLRVFNAAIAKAQSGFGGGGDMGAGGGVPSGGLLGGEGGTGAGGKNVHDVLLGDGQGKGGGNAYGFNPPKPISQMSMGELYDYQRSVMVPTTAARGVGKGKGSSAAGAYQIVSTTLASAAPKVLGENWRSLPFSAENQEKLGKYLFEQAKASGTDLHKVWEGLPPGTNPKNLSWDQVRDKITLAESGGTVGGRGAGNGQPVVGDPRRSAVVLQASIDHSISQDELIPLATDLAKDWSFTGDSTAVGKLLTNKGGTFEGENADYVQAQVEKVMKDNGIKNPAVAGRILARARNGRQGAFYDAFDWLPGADGLKSSINWDKVKQLAGFAKDREAVSRVALSISDALTAKNNITASQAQANAALLAQQARASAAAARGRRVYDPTGGAQVAQTAAAAQAALLAAVPQAQRGLEPDTSDIGTNKVPVATNRPPVKADPAKVREFTRALSKTGNGSLLLRSNANKRAPTDQELWLQATRGR